MTQAEAKTKLTLLCEASTDPQLSSDELDAILLDCKRADSEGRSITDDDYEETYDLFLAAYMGWRQKAGKCVGRFDFSADGATFNRSQIRKHCIDQANEFKAGIGSILTPKPNVPTAMPLNGEVAGGPDVWKPYGC